MQCDIYRKRVAGGLLLKALGCGLKGPGFQSHMQQRFIFSSGCTQPYLKN